MQRFIDEVLDSLTETYDSLEDLVFVLPNKRAGTFLLKAISSRLDRTIFAPKIISIETFLESLSGLKLAPHTFQLFELYKAYTEITLTPDSFHDFLNWASALLRDFNEIDRYLVDQHKLFAYLSDIHEIKQWGISPDSTPMIKQYLQFWKDLGPLYDRFLSNLKDKGYAHSGAIYRAASEHISDYIQKNPDTKHVFIGFNALTKAESQVIQAIVTRTESSIYWDIDKALLQDKDHDASFFIRQYQTKWKKLIEEGLLGITEHYSKKKNIQVIGVPKRVSQAQYVGNLVNDRVSDNGNKALEDVAVVLGDESLLNPLLHTLPEEIRQVNITMGYPLEKTSLASFFKQLLNIYAIQDRTGWPIKSVAALLGHAYVSRFLGKQAASALSELSITIRESRQVIIRPDQLRTDQDDNSKIQLLFPDSGLTAKSALERINTIIAHLKAQSDEEEKKIELEHLYGFYRIFNQLQTFIAEYPFLDDLTSLSNLFENLLRLETIDMRGEPLQGLQVMGMLESRVLDFETVIITSVNEGILPAGKSDVSLIPFDVKSQFGLPTYKEKDAIYTYHFYRLLQRARQVYLLYNTEPDVLIGGEKSRLIMQVLNDSLLQGQVQESIAITKDEVIPRREVIIEKTPRLLDAIKARSEKGLTPTLLASYIRDPLEFYKKAILQISDRSDDIQYIDPMAMGTIIHNAAEVLYSPLIGQVLSKSLLEKQKQRIPEIVEAQFQAELPKDAYSTGKNHLAFHVVLHQLQRLLQYDIQLSQAHQIEIIALEKPLSLELSVPGVEYRVRLKGVADRIDHCDGRLRIIDYKTGGLRGNELRVSSWDELISKESRQKAFQVLCYALMAGESYKTTSMTAGILSFKHLHRGLVPFEFKIERQIQSDITTSELELFREQLILLLQKICDPKTPFEERLAS